MFNRVYKLTLEFDDAKKLKSKLGIKFSHLCKVFSDKFVPLLMTETLKELRRSAEIELAGPKNSENTGDLKKMLSNTVKATKVAKKVKQGVLASFINHFLGRQMKIYIKPEESVVEGWKSRSRVFLEGSQNF